ncbi:hypothetical protein CCP4SC76_6640004 [Gammaproteobacteria bacterium]
MLPDGANWRAGKGKLSSGWQQVLTRAAFPISGWPLVDLEESKNPVMQNHNRIQLGSPAWTRTTDLMINSHLLYQLSYRGIDGTIITHPAPLKTALAHIGF